MSHDPISLRNTGAYIARLQLGSGAIPWFAGAITDPWDHVEAAMGLTIAGRHEEARRAFDWLTATQRDDGGWYAAYQDTTVVDDSRIETNFVAYPATGLWHYFLATGDKAMLARHWPMMERAIGFVLRLQSEHGDIYWALDTRTGISRDALITGCSSIYKSLECAIRIAAELEHPTAAWSQARRRLGDALRNRAHRFDRTWASKGRYSMDWFYPVLTGVVRGEAARQRLNHRWPEFVQAGLGCRCVVEQPWVTMAETCELAMACIAAGWDTQARQLFDGLRRFQTEDGGWWTGYVFTDKVLWPDERPTWTAGAILLCADALFGLSGAHQLFAEHAAE